MQRKSSRFFSIVGLISVVIFSMRIANAQKGGGVSLQEQLAAQYKLVKIGNATGEVTIVEPGTVLSIQKGGIVGVIPKSLAMCASKYENGNLKAPNSFCVGMLGQQNIRYLTVGEKVYPMKLDVNIPKEKISIAILECDSCNGVQEPSNYKAEVTFQFAKGYLETANAGQIEDTIGQVFAISEDDSQQGQGGQGNQGGNDQGGQDQGGGQANQQQAEPQTIEIGQTPEQVVAAMGKPEKIVNMGVKQIYLYKDLKVTFVKGKVSDVQ
jgi:hypothetical protein